MHFSYRCTAADLMLMSQARAEFPRLRQGKEDIGRNDGFHLSGRSHVPTGTWNPHPRAGTGSL